MVGTTTKSGWRRRFRVRVALAALAGIVAHPAHASNATGRIERIAVEGTGSATRVVIALSRPLTYDVKVLDGDTTGTTARRLVLDFSDATLGPEVTKPIAAASGVLRQVRTGQFDAKTARVVVELASDAPHTVEASTSPAAVTIFLGDASAADAGTPTAPPLAAPPPADAAAEAPKPAETRGPSQAPAALAEAPRATPRVIPIRARGRRPYSLNYTR